MNQELGQEVVFVSQPIQKQIIMLHHMSNQLSNILISDVKTKDDLKKEMQWSNSNFTQYLSKLLTSSMIQNNIKPTYEDSKLKNSIRLLTKKFNITTYFASKKIAPHKKVPWKIPSLEPTVSDMVFPVSGQAYTGNQIVMCPYFKDLLCVHTLKDLLGVHTLFTC